MALFYKDFYPLINRSIKAKWTTEWEQSHGHLRDIMEVPGTMTSVNNNRRHQVVINRLRCGHTWLTHGYIMNSEIEEAPPGCPLCQQCRLTLKHLIMECSIFGTNMETGRNHEDYTWRGIEMSEEYNIIPERNRSICFHMDCCHSQEE